MGWKIGDEMTAQLVIDALNMAGTPRKPTTVIHHSDQGSQYTSLEFGKRCKALGVRPSMGSVGDAYDNAMAESFFASLECELLDRKVLKTRTQARLALFTYIEGWSNPRRRHGALGQLSPANFETKHAHQFSRAQSSVDLPKENNIELKTKQTTCEIKSTSVRQFGVNPGALTRFGREIRYLKSNGYGYDAATGKMTMGIKP